MNKLPWFTHDNDAHEDKELRLIFMRHGGILRGYGAYWILVEVLDRHGKGDQVEILWQDLEAAMGVRRSCIRPLLAALSARGKLDVCEDSASILRYEIKKFRERQAKLKSKIRSRLPEDSTKTPQDIRGEKKKKKTTTTGRQAADKPYDIKTDQQRLMCSYKVVKGVAAEDRSWDQHNYKTWARACSKLLGAFKGKGGVNAAIDFLSAKSAEFEKKGLSWTLATIAKHAWDSDRGGSWTQ